MKLFRPTTFQIFSFLTFQLLLASPCLGTTASQGWVRSYVENAMRYIVGGSTNAAFAASVATNSVSFAVSTNTVSVVSTNDLSGIVATNAVPVVTTNTIVSATYESLAPTAADGETQFDTIALDVIIESHFGPATNSAATNGYYTATESGGEGDSDGIPDWNLEWPEGEGGTFYPKISISSVTVTRNKKTYKKDFTPPLTLNFPSVSLPAWPSGSHGHIYGTDCVCKQYGKTPELPAEYNAALDAAIAIGESANDTLPPDINDQTWPGTINENKAGTKRYSLVLTAPSDSTLSETLSLSTIMGSDSWKVATAAAMDDAGEYLDRWKAEYIRINTCNDGSVHHVTNIYHRCGIYFASNCARNPNHMLTPVQHQNDAVTNLVVSPQYPSFCKWRCITCVCGMVTNETGDVVHQYRKEQRRPPQNETDCYDEWNKCTNCNYEVLVEGKPHSTIERTGLPGGTKPNGESYKAGIDVCWGWYDFCTNCEQYVRFKGNQEHGFTNEVNLCFTPVCTNCTYRDEENALHTDAPPVDPITQSDGSLDPSFHYCRCRKATWLRHKFGESVFVDEDDFNTYYRHACSNCLYEGGLAVGKQEVITPRVCPHLNSNHAGYCLCDESTPAAECPYCQSGSSSGTIAAPAKVSHFSCPHGNVEHDDADEGCGCVGWGYAAAMTCSYCGGIQWETECVNVSMSFEALDPSGGVQTVVYTWLTTGRRDGRIVAQFYSQTVEQSTYL